VAGLEGRVAVITGAGRGIGAAVAKRLAAKRVSVVVNDLGVGLDGSGSDPGPATQTTDEIIGAGGAAIADCGDIADFAVAAALVDKALDRFGKLDIIVNAAGTIRDELLFRMAEDEWDDVIRVHLKGTFNLTRHAAAYWQSLGRATAQHRIINFTSAAGLLGSPSGPNYASAKMGVVGLTYVAANTLARHGVTVNAIAPSADTRMTHSALAKLSAGRPRRVEDVATVVAYLASTQSDWCTGRVIGVSGTQVSLYCDPAVIRQIDSAQPWDLGSLGEALQHSFSGVPRPCEGVWEKVHQQIMSAGETP